MEDLSRKFRSLDWKSLQKSARRMQQSTASALKDLVMTDLENKTRSATADTPWGASTTDLQSIAQGTYNRDDYALIMSIVWQRLASSRWRCVYKALEVLKYLIMHGSSRCLEEARGALGHLETLRMYRKVEGGRDVGEGVRKRAEGVVEMLRDEMVLSRERDRSEELRRKMVGGGEGVYSNRYHDSSGGYDESVNRVGTSGFKGYDDDIGSGGTFKGYDDDVSDLKGYGEGGQNAQVDDLLGDDISTQTPQQDDDDDFDPRGDTNVEERKNIGELFSALELTETKNTSDNLGGDDVHVESTSALVARLAAEKGSVVPVSTSNPPGDGNSSSIWDDDPVPKPTNPTISTTDKGIWNNPNPKSASQPKVTKKESDPFSQLLATAKKTL